MRRVASAWAVVVLAGCGSSVSIHYNQAKALECLRQADSTTLHSAPHGIFMAFLSDDGVSAIERVAVAFAPLSAETESRSLPPTQLGFTTPDWTEHRGDAEVWAVGPYEPPIAKRQGITDAQARAAAKTLGAGVRAAIDDCLKQNER